MFEKKIINKGCLEALNMKFSEKTKFWPIRKKIVKFGLF